MRWDRVKASFLDELEKISEVSLLGVSSERALAVPEPSPMETAGFLKARALLERAEQMKTAAAQQPGQKKQPQTVIQQAKGFGGHVLGGMAGGKFLSDFAHGPQLAMTDAARATQHRTGWKATAAGGALGAAEYGRRRIKQWRQSKTAGAFSPGLALKWGQQTGKARSSALRATGSIASHVRGSQIH